MSDVVSADDLKAVEALSHARTSVLAQIEKRVVGQKDVVDALLVSLFSRGHCLFVGVPGLAKTLLISTLADVLRLSFNRIQFTPDLMPGDLTGSMVIEGSGHELTFREGPVFTSQRPASIYAATQGVGADLLVAAAQPGWRTNPLVGHARPWLSARADALDAAYESPHGLFALFDPRNPAGGIELSGVSIYDIAPTLLNLFGIAPARMRGHALA